MNKLTVILVCLTAVIFTGCTSTKNLTEGIASKSLCTSGTVVLSKVDETGFSNLFVWGTYISKHDGDEMMNLEMSESPSIFNKDAVEKKTKFFFATDDKDRMDEVIKKVTPAVAK